MTTAELSALADEIQKDPDQLGYAPHAAIGADAAIATLLNASIKGAPSRWSVVQPTAGDVSSSDVSAALESSRIDAAVAAYKAGTWPTIAVPIPDNRITAAGLTPAHFAAAKINNEGTALGVPEELHAEALALVGQIDQAKADTVAAAFPQEKLNAEQARIDGVASRLIAIKQETAKSQAFDAAVATAIAGKGP